MTPPTTIIPIASGKGGVGKSIFSANLAIALARLGHPTIAVDLDLGGSNLHTCLGMPNTLPGIGDFLKSRQARFEDLPAETPFTNLKFLPGDGKTPFMANLSHPQRIRLARAIRTLPARYVILDLGAGSSFNTLNLFGLAASGIMITTFETTSIMNCVMFLRNFIFRMLSGIACKDETAFGRLIQAFEQPSHAGAPTLESLLDTLHGANPGIAERAERFCGRFRPRIVFNMGDHPDELAVLPRITATLRKGLSMEADYLGFLFYDDAVRRSAKNRETLLMHHPFSAVSRGIAGIAETVALGWDAPMADSAARLAAETRKLHTQREGRDHRERIAV
ncbi:P-loop NTPase [Desulfococcus sp.]|uniref:nucleotide-binding protein n=1 Tax=Desulfococcus sp. TaxID=2025834 RepID=UPI003593A403